MNNWQGTDGRAETMAKTKEQLVFTHKNWIPTVVGEQGNSSDPTQEDSEMELLEKKMKMLRMKKELRDMEALDRAEAQAEAQAQALERAEVEAPA